MHKSFRSLRHLFGARFCFFSPRRRSGERTEERLPRILCAHSAPEPTPSPSQEGSKTGWPVALLGGVRGGLVADKFIGSRHCIRENSFAQHGKQMMQFLIDLFWSGHRLRNLGADQFAVALTQPVHGHFDCSFAHIQ